MKGKFLVEMSIEEYNEYNGWLHNLRISDSLFRKSYSGMGATFAEFYLLSREETLVAMSKEIGELKNQDMNNYKEIQRLKGILDEKKIKY